MDYEVIVLGAGAAGLMAALRAAERGRRTLLLEKNRKAGVKILMSGGTRCNLTHDTDARGIVAAFGRQGRFLHSALARLGPRDLVALFAAEGVPTKVEPGGKVFPQSDRALDVLRGLRARLHRSGAALALGQPATDLTRHGEGFAVATPQRQFTAARVILATGGVSYPRCGTTGDGYRWAAQLGHTIVPPRPALAPLASDAPWIRPLAGLTLPDATVRVYGVSAAAAAKPLAESRGGLLLTHFGLSGPAPMNVSRAIAAADDPQQVRLVVDWLPDWNAARLEEHFARCRTAEARRQIENVLPVELPARLRAALAGLAGIAAEKTAAELSRGEAARLVECLKRLPVPVAGTLGFSKAEVTAGGVALDEVDSRTMQSKRVAGLFLAGEILDLDGPIGGYNFQAAFSTGYLAGESV